MSGSIRFRAIILVPLVVFALVSCFFASGYLVTVILGLPFSFAFPLPVRLFGLVPTALGLGFLGWLFAFRKPIDIVVSTYVTFVKAVRRTNLGRQSGRTEPLIVLGPYRYVRHPIYFSVLSLVFGWWLLLDYTFLSFASVLLLLWFKFVVAPFEEKELVAIFGDQYKAYAKDVPGLIPLTKRSDVD